jgi:hypothetical protein
VGLIRSIVYFIVFVAVIYFGTTVKLGQRTLFGHVRNIWAADETQEMVKEIKKSSGPVVERVQRGVNAGLDEARRGPVDAGVGPVDAGVGPSGSRRGPRSGARHGRPAP